MRKDFLEKAQSYLRPYTGPDSGIPGSGIGNVGFVGGVVGGVVTSSMGGSVHREPIIGGYRGKNDVEEGGVEVVDPNNFEAEIAPPLEGGKVEIKNVLSSASGSGSGSSGSVSVSGSVGDGKVVGGVEEDDGEGDDDVKEDDDNEIEEPGATSNVSGMPSVSTSTSGNTGGSTGLNVIVTDTNTATTNTTPDRPLSLPISQPLLEPVAPTPEVNPGGKKK